MRRRAFVVALLLPVAARAADATIEINNFMFMPAELTVAAGTTVTWINRDDTPHKVVDRDDPHRIKAPALDTGDSFRFVYETPGIYHYFCSLHPYMQGTVVVR
jgi:plastocyanin